MGGTEVVDGSRSMRYVLMIDEAHDLFREKKSLEILEVLLRKIRSYGVSIIYSLKAYQNIIKVI